MNVYEKLQKVQTETVATKDAYNSFGKYNYRSCESILEAVKPILNKYGCTITIRDEVQQIGERFYIKAIAAFADCENEGMVIEVSAFAREEESKKGMDGAQVTGSSSSYARKYALAGLLLLDDNKDPDTTNKHGKDKDDKEKSNEPFPDVNNRINQEQIDRLTSLTTQLKDGGKGFSEWLKKKYNTDDITTLTIGQYVKVLSTVAQNIEKERVE